MIKKVDKSPELISSNAAKRVLIVGGGFAGLSAACRLRRLARGAEIILIDPQDCFTFFPAIYRLAAGELPESAVCTPIAQIANRRGFTFFHDEVEKIDWRRNFALTQKGERIPFDYCIIAVGGRTNYYGIPGMEEYAFALKTKDDAERLEEHASELVRRKGSARFVVCGGGLSGVEFASELQGHLSGRCGREWDDNSAQERLKRENAREGNGNSRHKVTVVHALPRLVPELPQAGGIAEGRLREIGVELVLDSPVVRVGRNLVMTAGGRKIGADVIVWAGGMRTHELIGRSRFPTVTGGVGKATAGSGAAVNRFLQTTANPRIFAVGDCMAPVDAELRRQVIKTAWNAAAEGETAAHNVAALMNGGPLRPFNPTACPVLFTIGRDFGVFHYRGLMLAGRWVVWLKGLFEKIYARNFA
ncbi:FAD-dependent oxidoreductase [Candidatus Micrarchaeota archaeon]|nr:FAD-dependent oxidoreductase [Candidatus Micrarchaeota archaeon]